MFTQEDFNKSFGDYTLKMMTKILNTKDYIRQIPAIVVSTDGSDATVYQAGDDASNSFTVPNRTGGTLSIGEVVSLLIFDNTLSNSFVAFGGTRDIPSGNYSDENARDAIGAALVAGTNMSIDVNDSNNTITISTSGTSYTHPASHPATMITEDSNNRFVTDTEKTTWNGKQSALGFTPEDTSKKGAANGYAGLDGDGKVPSTQLPAYVDDVIEFASEAAMRATTGSSGKIYVTTDDHKTYRWTGSGFAEISASLVLGEASGTAYRGDRGKVAYDHTSSTSNPHSVTKAQVGLGNCDNTSDASKPVSIATQTELDKKADIGTIGIATSIEKHYTTTTVETSEVEIRTTGFLVGVDTMELWVGGIYRTEGTEWEFNEAKTHFGPIGDPWDAETDLNWTTSREMGELAPRNEFHGSMIVNGSLSHYAFDNDTTAIIDSKPERYSASAVFPIGTSHVVTKAACTSDTIVRIYPQGAKVGSWSVVSTNGSFTVTSDKTETSTVNYYWEFFTGGL